MHDEHKIQTIHDNFQLLTYYNIYPVGHPKAPTREQTTKLKEKKLNQNMIMPLCSAHRLFHKQH